MAHEWRDLFSTYFLENTFLGKANTYYPPTSPKWRACNELKSAIANYHNIPKTSLGELEARRGRLKSIARKVTLALKLWNRTEEQVRSEDNKGRTIVQGKQFDYADQSILRLLVSIRRRALRKAAYLKVLKKHFSSRKARSVAGFKALLAMPHSTDGELVGLHAGVRLEQLDPLHRVIEFDEKPKTDGVNQYYALEKDANGRLLRINPEWDEGTNDYTRALGEWFNGSTETPFFLYLESTPVCLGVDKAINSTMTKVNYCNLNKKGASTPIQSKVKVCYIGEFAQVWCGYPGCPVSDFRVCDTSDYTPDPSKAPAGWAAYVFSEFYELFLGDHKPTFWHHSSFVSGNPVRCAGMIQITHGKVTGVTDHSGHYRPSPRHLYNFGSYLEQQGVLDPQCDISSRKFKFDGKWADFKRGHYARIS